MSAIQRLEKQLADTKAKLLLAQSLRNAINNWLAACKRLGKDITHICIPMKPGGAVKYITDGYSVGTISCVELPKEEVAEVRDLIITKAFRAYKQAKAAYGRFK